MGINNNAKIIRRDLMVRIGKLLLEGGDLSELDRIILTMRPKHGEHVRCCTYRDRAVLKYKTMAMMGFAESMETDELRSLKDYYIDARSGLTRTSPVLSVVDEACRSCNNGKYVVTNMCQGCVGRPCMLNCPKKSISFHKGKAEISPETCVNCGICQKMCPYHAIIYTPVPCEEVCPVDAIRKDGNGKEKIDESKCILCGKCLDVCPFGAVVEKTHLFDLIELVKQKKKIVALVAPSIAGQFRDSMGKIMQAFLRLGFTDVMEVALGADVTIVNEAEEFRHFAKLKTPMTTSCCRSYVNLMQKHAPELMGQVSKTLSPMAYTAEIARKMYPDAALVFVSPCLAKKEEANIYPNVDYVLNFEEFGIWLVAAGLEISDGTDMSLQEFPSSEARYFGQAGGVALAVASKLEGLEFSTQNFDGIDRTFLKKLRPVLKQKTPMLIEVMSCERGCVGGCSTITTPAVAERQVKLFVENPSYKKQ